MLQVIADTCMLTHASGCHRLLSDAGMVEHHSMHLSSSSSGSFVSLQTLTSRRDMALTCQSWDATAESSAQDEDVASSLHGLRTAQTR